MTAKLVAESEGEKVDKETGEVEENLFPEMSGQDSTKSIIGTA